MRKRDIDMINGPLLSNVIAFTVPAILTGLLQLLFNTADLIVVGRYCGSVTVGAVSSTGSLTALIINMFIGLSVGAGVTVARGVGARDYDDVSKTVHTSMLFALTGGVILTFIGVFFSGTFLEWMDSPHDVIGLSTKYMRIYFCGAIPMLVYNFGAAILRAVGDTKRPLIFISIAGVVNVILNVIFVKFFGMDVDGVALATVVSQTISATLIVLSLMSRDDACRLFIKQLRFHGRQFKEMLKIGVPAGIQASLFSISNVIIQKSVNSFESIVVTGNGAAANIENYVWTIMNAFQQTSLNFVGQNMGARNYKRLSKIMWTCLACVAACGLFFGWTVVLFGKKLLHIFIVDSAESIVYGMVRIKYICSIYFLCGMMDVVTGGLRGAGRSVSAMLITIAGVCGVRLVWIYTIFRIPEYHSIESLYFSYPISWIATMLIELGCFVYVSKRLMKQTVEITE